MLTATHNESSNPLGSTSIAASVLIYGYPTGGGTFVIGDGNAAVGRSVTFWGSQWEKLNTLSWRSVQREFQGLRSLDDGHGVHGRAGQQRAPAASVPSYLGVLVTSKVTKSGSNVAGTIVRRVVVKVNPGYAGTGTIVTVIP